MPSKNSRLKEEETGGKSIVNFSCNLHRIADKAGEEQVTALVESEVYCPENQRMQAAV